MAQFEFIFWLIYWYFHTRIFKFDWDEGNATKSHTKHGVSTDEVESVFNLKMAVLLGRQVSPVYDEERFGLVGPSQKGRLLAICFTIRENKVRPISSRIASRKERKFYEDVRKKT